ncbi:hypothetical protein RA28_10620 [Ruegeria sp. ANG-S4]|nr:hypothetical protein RA28_10620 [Ruegeria sp. ANG-S4]
MSTPYVTGLGDCDQFASDDRDDDFVKFACIAKSVGKDFHDGIVMAGNDSGVEHHMPQKQSPTAYSSLFSQCTTCRVQSEQGQSELRPVLLRDGPVRASRRPTLRWRQGRFQGRIERGVDPGRGQDCILRGDGSSTPHALLWRGIPGLVSVPCCFSFVAKYQVKGAEQFNDRSKHL